MRVAKRILISASRTKPLFEAMGIQSRRVLESSSVKTFRAGRLEVEDTVFVKIKGNRIGLFKFRIGIRIPN